MINYVNEAINRKLASISFTTIVSGLVTSIDPLKIKINDRITIGLDFIEPMSLGINDDSPSPALPFIVGEKVQMIRYNNGQRFYLLSLGLADYNDLLNKPILNTNNSAAQAANDAEEIKGTLKLHKISKTGSYNDLLNKPILNTNNSAAQAASSAEEINGTIKLHKISKTGKYSDLIGLPTIPAAQIQSDWNQTTTTSADYIKNKPAILEFEVVDTW